MMLDHCYLLGHFCNSLLSHYCHSWPPTVQPTYQLGCKSGHVSPLLQTPVASNTFFPWPPRLSVSQLPLASPALPSEPFPSLTAPRPHVAPCLPAHPPCTLSFWSLLLEDSSSRQLDREDECQSSHRKSEVYLPLSFCSIWALSHCGEAGFHDVY